MSVGWQALQLGDVCQLKYGKSLPKAKRSGSGSGVFGSNGQVGLHEETLTEGATIIVGRKGSLGEVTYSLESCWPIDTTYYIDCSTTDADLRWLYFRMRAMPLTQLNRAAAVPGLNRDDAYAQPLLLPPIEEQRRIAAVLDAAEALRAKRRQALVQLDTLTQAVFIDMFGDPVHNRRGWRMAPLTELGNLDRGVSRHRPRNDPVLLDGRWPLIQTGDVAASGGYITEFETTYSDAGLAQSKIWPRGTLCITIAANIAKTGILTFDACFPDSVVGFTARREGASEFVRAVLDHLQPILEQQAPESAQKNINLKVLRGIQVPVPPEKLMVEYASRVAGVAQQQAYVSQHLEGLDTLFVSLQQRAFRGEL